MVPWLLPPDEACHWREAGYLQASEHGSLAHSQLRAHALELAAQRRRLLGSAPQSGRGLARAPLRVLTAGWGLSLELLCCSTLLAHHPPATPACHSGTLVV